METESRASSCVQCNHCLSHTYAPVVTTCHLTSALGLAPAKMCRTLIMFELQELGPGSKFRGASTMHSKLTKCAPIIHFQEETKMGNLSFYTT